MKVYYYLSLSGSNPVLDFINSLTYIDRAKIRRIFQTIQEYGLDAVSAHIKKLSGTPIWEIRVLGKTSIRILYVTINQEMVLVLHSFVKKTQKTPENEISTSIKRLIDYQERSKP